MSEEGEDEIVAQIVRYARSGNYVSAKALRAQIEADFPNNQSVDAAMKRAATALFRQYQN